MKRNAIKPIVVTAAVILLVSLSCNIPINFGDDAANQIRNVVETEVFFDTPTPTPTKNPLLATATISQHTATQTKAALSATATLVPASATAIPRSPTAKPSATAPGSYTARGQFQATADMYCTEWVCQISFNALEMTVRPAEGVVTGQGTIKLIGDRAGCPAVETTMTFDFVSQAYSENWFNGTVTVTVNRAFPKERCSAATTFSSAMPWEAEQGNGKISGKLTGKDNVPFPFLLTRVP